MAIPYGRLASLSARKLEGALRKDGFDLVRQTGSHRQFQHPDGRRVTLPYHSSGETFLPRTLNSIIASQAHWSEEDLKRLGLLK